MNCPLCKCSEYKRIFEDKRRSYLLCSECNLLFVPPEYHLSTSEEKAEYIGHDVVIFDHS